MSINDRHLHHCAYRHVQATPVVLILALLFVSCGLFRKPVVPMPRLDLTQAEGNTCLIVLLPGRLTKPHGFEKHGFDQAVADRGLAADVTAVDAHLGYYRDRSVLDRLRADVIAPALAAGYDEVWLAGTSLGGIGSLLYLRDRPNDVAGVIALAPYLGPKKIIREIQDAGGPLAWTPPTTVKTKDIGRELWSWLAPWTQGESDTPLYLGWGTRDDLDQANSMLAVLLPENHVATVDGGHDWQAWAKLWGTFLDRAQPCGRR